ncbi:MAG: hypothetical protein Kow00106_00990 [Anaerolineae bacterium]
MSSRLRMGLSWGELPDNAQTTANTEPVVSRFPLTYTTGYTGPENLRAITQDLSLDASDTTDKDLVGRGE